MFRILVRELYTKNEKEMISKLGEGGGEIWVFRMGRGVSKFPPVPPPSLF